MTIYFAHISDTHIGRLGSFYQDFDTTANTRQVIDILNNLPVRPDFVIHTGDVVTDHTEENYALARDLFSELTLPIYFVTGNHDLSSLTREYMTMPPVTPLLPGSDLMAYTFMVQGEQFLVIDARGPDEIDPHGLISAEQLNAIRKVATPDGPPLTVFIHQAVLPMDSPDMDANMLLIDGLTLHEALLPARDRLRGVFHGHIHQPMQTIRDGIVYTSAPSTFAQFAAWPNTTTTTVQPQRQPGFNFVHLLPQQMIVHFQTFKPL